MESASTCDSAFLTSLFTSSKACLMGLLLNPHSDSPSVVLKDKYSFILSLHHSSNKSGTLQKAPLLLSKNVLPFRDRKNILILAKFQY